MSQHLLVQGDARRLPLADGSVHCVVTSPPYWGLRDYGTATWDGGDPGCDHKVRIEASRSDLTGGGCRSWSERDVSHNFLDVCGKCGARRIDAQLGLEATPEAFVAAMTGVFREVWRVLRDDGTAWVNLGDVYNSSPSNQRGRTGSGMQETPKYAVNGKCGMDRQHRDIAGLKPKDLVGIPWRVAFALQADGWYLRSDIIWAKPNPMPESVTDRPTKSHEYLFLLSKRERYFFDSDAVREKQSAVSESRYRYAFSGTPGADAVNDRRTVPAGMREIDPAGRNIRSVWSIPSEAYAGCHFATFPRKLVAPCIKAGTSARGVCPTCGAPWERLTEKETIPTQRVHNGVYDASSGFGVSGWLPGRQNVSTLGWRPTCSHDAPPIPATVLDIFAGSGTTGVVALALRRNFIGVDLSAKYLHMAERRISRPHARVERAVKHEPMPLFPEYVE